MATIIASDDWWRVTENSDGTLELYIFCNGDMPMGQDSGEPSPPWERKLDWADAGYSVDNITSVRFANTVTDIGYGAFYTFAGITEFEIPPTITAIRSNAFATHALTSVVIPDSVTLVEIGAFSTPELSDVYYTGTEAQWNEIEIDDYNFINATIHYNYVPEPEPAATPKIAYTGQSKVIKRLCELVSGLYAAPHLIVDSGGYICADYGGSDNGD